ncbi:MAG: nucleotidyltransferase family protein [Clostridia bacterium]|nr:nucleotidyltransferase family protein [Clostridia bacterium]MDE7329309.1 nucleotidyltransferase family protein [Clostridia bacterium]
MKIAFVICEYNPFQNGHAYHLNATRSLSQCDKIICVMSGNVTQRGELAIADKYARAKWAILSGADMVVELPPQYVLTTAKYFALGAVKIANAVKGEKYLSFGSECGNIDTLKAIADFEENQDFKSTLNKYLKAGYGYAKSLSSALGEISQEYAQIISLPNNVLGVEYLRALRLTNSSISPLTVARQGGGYLDDKKSDTYSSASAVRKMLEANDIDGLKNSVPDSVFNDLIAKSKDKTSVEEKLFSILKYIVSERNLAGVHGVKEGVENRILNAINSSQNLREFYEKVATKRYTDSYIARTALNIILGNYISGELLELSAVKSVNILAVEENSKYLLSLFDCDVNTKNSTLEPNSMILVADRLYSSVYSNMPYSMITVKR